MDKIVIQLKSHIFLGRSYVSATTKIVRLRILYRLLVTDLYQTIFC